MRMIAAMVILDVFGTVVVVVVVVLEDCFVFSREAAFVTDDDVVFDNTEADVLIFVFPGDDVVVLFVVVVLTLLLVLVLEMELE